MNKKTIIENISTDLEITKKDATTAFNMVFENITEGMEDDSVLIPGFGTFKLSQRKARIGRNPQTGEALNIPARKAVSFSASKTLKDLFN